MGEEIKVKRANVILRVPAGQKEEYLAKGFDVISEDGKVLEATIPNDIVTLQAAYVKHLAQIKELEDKLAQATKKPTAKKADADATPKKRTTKAKAE